MDEKSERAWQAIKNSPTRMSIIRDWASRLGGEFVENET